ncbi:YgfZ/GcvT domain-containing protein [Aurantimicrobium minutum]|uniref:CAF17-like 4Fe-4S cluster assembly/insertion protein YgfZ n=1 Tax=Aurantimicrobium minutum TaxID=708131 RepID=UPI0024762CF3|nr:glycine cleavage T C-terminal barrel domain-containing protein [Aurantimicrobium minutum]MDH6255963.1 folate-binding protein YgfZ [Aurantimicrobium minutum]
MADDASSAPGDMPLSPLTALPGAIVGATGVASAYGNSLTEQRSLLAGSALVDLSDRGVIEVSGPDRLGWLDSLLSQRLDNLKPGQSAETLLLDPHGHVQHAMRVFEDGQTTWLLVDEGRSAELTKWLLKMRFMKQVEVDDRSAEMLTLGYFGELPDVLLPLILQPADVPVIWHDPWNDVAEGGWQYSAQEHPGTHWNYSEAVVPRSAANELVDLATAGVISFAGTDALEALRIAAWRPRIATEGDDNALPHEFDWLRTAVHLNKGCYRGQETVAKVHNLGHPPRRLAFLSLDGVDVVLPEAGAAVLDGETEVGHITSAARHFEEGVIALAILKRNANTDAELVVVSDGTRIPATQVVIVPPEAGRTANVPRLPRLGAVKREQ